MDPTRSVGELRTILATHAARVDAEGIFPQESFEAIQASGLMGLLVPTEFGGLGGGLKEMVGIASELAGACLSSAMIWVMHCQQVDAVVRHGAERLREELLPRVASDGYYLASVTTEPTKGGHLLSARSPLHSMQGADLVVHRSAPVVTGGEHADGFLITMLEAADAAPNRVTLVHVDRSQASLTTVRPWDSMGMRATASIGMEIDATVAPYQVIGKPGAFREVAVDSMIATAHLGWSACWLGTARNALASFIALIRSPDKRRSVDLNDEVLRHRLARARMELDTAETYLLRLLEEVSRRRSNGITLEDRDLQTQLDTLKVIASEASYSIVDRLMQVGGAFHGYLRNAPVQLERHFRDLRSASLNYSNDRLLSSIGGSVVLRAAGASPFWPLRESAQTGSV